jgi:hypothetical protein
VIARRVSHHWQAMYRHGFYRGDIVLMSAISSVISLCRIFKKKRWECRSTSCLVAYTSVVYPLWTGRISRRYKGRVSRRLSINEDQCNDEPWLVITLS